ncbi:MAG: M1 family metallopeptidase [Haliangiales bacterium]
MHFAQQAAVKTTRLAIWLAFGIVIAGCSGSQTAAPSSPEPITVTPTSPVDAADGAPAAGEVAAPALRLPAGVAPLGYRAELDLDPSSEAFRGSIYIELEVTEPSDVIWLHAAELVVERAAVTVGDERWPATDVLDGGDFLGVRLPKTLPAGSATLEIAYRGEMPLREDSGVFRRVDGQHTYIYTQFEPLAARRAFPCFDEPSFKVPWQLTIHAPDGQRAFTNTPLVETVAGPRAGTKSFRFAETKPVPSYLLAFAVGPFETVDLGTIGRGDTPARIVVPRGHTESARYAAELTPRLLVLLEDYFDMAYPYAKLDSIAIPHFGGAMEHPGLITYSDRLLLASPAHESVDFQRSYASVGLHELAHQWFGNLVTMVWWDDLWLNESFATWLSAKMLVELEPAWDGQLRALDRTEGSMAVDGLLSARRIRQPITQAGDISAAFDPISYGKGSAVLTMFERWLGAEPFRAGVRQYMRAFAWKNATGADFVGALAAATDEASAGAMSSFLDQSGLPVLSVDLFCEPGEPPSLELAQERYLPAGSAGSSTERTWQIPVCVKYGRGAAVREQCQLLAEDVDTMVLDNAKWCPTWVMANRDAAGYYRVAYGPEMQTALLGPARRRLTVAERVRVRADIAALVTAGKMEMGEVLRLMPALLRDRDEHLIRSAAEIVGSMSANLVTAELRANYARYIRKTFGARARQLGWEPRANETDARRRLRQQLVTMVAIEGADPRLIASAQELAERWLETRAGVDPNILSEVLAAAAFHGDEALRQRIQGAIVATTDRVERRALINALAHTRDPERVRQNLRFAASGKLDIRAARTLVRVPLAWPESRAAVYEFIKEHYDALIAKLPRRGVIELVRTARELCQPALREDAATFFEPRVKDVRGGPQALAQALERIDLCVASRKIQLQSVSDTLSRY